jgi:hypothetical protein
MIPIHVFCQSGILAVGRGNKVVEPVVDSDGMFPRHCAFLLKAIVDIT